MATVRASSLRRLRSPSTVLCCRHQRRWARVHDVRFVATHQATSERITDRYRNQLEQKAREKGLKDIGQLKEAYQDEISNLKKKATVPGANAPMSTQQQQQRLASQANAQMPWPNPPAPPAQPLDQLSPSSPNYKAPGVKTLSSFIDVEKALDLPHREIEALWRLRHAGSPQSLAAVMPSDQYSTISRTARRHPQFILPGLPRNESNDEQKSGDLTGAPIHFLQWTFPAPHTATVLFTHLAEYKLRGEHAQPHTTLTHHLELSDPKSLVLCQGTVTPDRGVSMEEGKWLVMQLQRFYTIGEDVEEDDTAVGRNMKQNRRRLVEMFSRGDADFKIEELLAEAERLG